MESKWLLGFDETGDLEGPASAMCGQWLNAWEKMRLVDTEAFSRA